MVPEGGPGVTVVSVGEQRRLDSFLARELFSLSLKPNFSQGGAWFFFGRAPTFEEKNFSRREAAQC